MNPSARILLSVCASLIVFGASTTLTDSNVHFTVPDKPCVVLQRGPLKVVVV